MSAFANPIFAPLRKGITSVGETGLTLMEIVEFLCRGQVDMGEMRAQLYHAGFGSLPIVSLSASFIGMAVSVQFAQEIVSRFGATNLVGGFVSIALLRELAPIFVAIVLAGNIGAAMTAEIGTMKVTDQIDAMQVFHIHPLEYLVLPRLVSTAIAGPILTIYGAVLAILTGQLFTEFLIGVPGPIFWDSVQQTATANDVFGMMVKSLVFAVTIALIASLNGLATRGSSEAVGRQTTKTVVWSLLAIFMLNYVLTSLFFQL